MLDGLFAIVVEEPELRSACSVDEAWMADANARKRLDALTCMSRDRSARKIWAFDARNLLVRVASADRPGGEDGSVWDSGVCGTGAVQLVAGDAR